MEGLPREPGDAPSLVPGVPGVPGQAGRGFEQTLELDDL